MTTRVLADWHHPALWESLSILLEDRFGWELYSPYGADWIDHGWRFDQSASEIGWGALDYLCPPDARDLGDHWLVGTPEYPERPRKAVTWAQARDARWAFVLASVPEHQASFSRLATDLGARFVHQIGNARGHLPDPAIPQVTLASARLRGRHSRAITYHQEFDRRLFGYGPPEPGSASAVSSFMLRLDGTSCDYRWLADDPRFRWWAATARSPRDPGYLSPAAAIAARMRSSGFTWHDKRIGDGYGHVLWSSAAMGRPLIGHGHHYRGLLGEPLWRDGVTCIDLDRRTRDGTLSLLRRLAQDPDQHRRLCERTAAAFDELVDWDGEADAILRALG